MSCSNKITTRMPISGVPQWVNPSCPQDACANVCPDFTIKRHDTKPDFKAAVEDCNGPLDLSDELLVLEANMWSDSRLKNAIVEEDDSIKLADGVGFDKVMENDIIIMEHPRSPEIMLVTGFDENEGLIYVQRGYHGSQSLNWKRGSYLKIFRMLNAAAEIEMVYEDVTDVVSGTVTKNQLQATYLVYKWEPNDTCVSGCFMLEFKLMKMQQEDVGIFMRRSSTPSTPSNISICDMGIGVEWVRRFPPTREGFVIQVPDSPTFEVS